MYAIRSYYDYATASVMLPVGGLIMALFIGYVIEPNRVESVVKHQLGFAYGIWHFSLRYVAPVALIV